MLPHDRGDLSRIYAQRFQTNTAYRTAVWRILVDQFFAPRIPPNAAILDLGCGYGEFINAVPAQKKYAMDLNPDAPQYLNKDVEFLHQDCSSPWPVPEGTLDTVFTSNFFEHLPSKQTLAATFDQIQKALKPGGCLIALGPNTRYLPGAYWDFWDHYLPLTELSLTEALKNRGFAIQECRARFLPYTMSGNKKPPLAFLRLYLALPLAWPIFGKQFLVIARRT